MRLTPFRRSLLVGAVVIVALVPAVLVGFALLNMNGDLRRVAAHADTVEARSARQGDMLAALGYPRDGSRGSRGPAGADGVNGINGVSIRGQQGQPGPTGSQGAPGVNGKNGNNGPTGKQGTPGVSITGSQGPKGDTGDQGPKGDQGEPGPAAAAIFVPDGQGGWCAATDNDGDGVYKCPDAEDT